jgi:hypothetical protein
MSQGPSPHESEFPSETRKPQKGLVSLAMTKGGRVGAWSAGLGGLTAALLFGVHSGWATEPRHGFWKEVVGASLCFGIPLFSFGWVIGYLGGATGGLVGALCVTRVGWSGVLVGAALGCVVAAGMEWLLIPARLFDWRHDWFLYLAAGGIPLGSGIGGWAGAAGLIQKTTL